jgi:hypothetical protein
MNEDDEIKEQILMWILGAVFGASIVVLYGLGGGF